MPPFRSYLLEPEWGNVLVLVEMFAAGLAAGTYLAYALMELFGNRQDKAVGRWLALVPAPLMVVAALTLVVDLGQPTRFLNVLFTSPSAVP